MIADQHNDNITPEAVRLLLQEYKQLQYDEDQPLKTIEAYHSWYNASQVLFRRHFGADDPDVRKFEDVDNSGNMYVLSHAFQSIYATYNILMDRVQNKQLYSETRADNSPQVTKHPKVFISHKTEDGPYAKAIIDMLVALGVKHQDIFCSSVQGYGIPFGKKIIDTLHNQFDQYNLFVIFIHSPRYYSSPVSLNEMGASWILRTEHRSFLTQDCEYTMLKGVINHEETAFRAGQTNTYHLLHEFRTGIASFFGLEPIPDAVWELQSKEFIYKVTAINEPTASKAPEQSKPHKEGKVTTASNARQFNDTSKEIIMMYLGQQDKPCTANQVSSYIKMSLVTTTRLLQELMVSGHVEAIGKGVRTKFQLKK